MREHSAWLHAFGISHGSIVYLACPWERSVSGGPVVAGEPRIFTIADLDQNRPTETDGGAFRYVAQPQPQQQMQSVLPVRRDPEEAVLEANAAVAAVERKRGREVEAAFATKRTRRD
ncbi:hypothetical protein H6P81_018630 [Aristolochia fimbriata]|uniref:Uncharacterized protein n=1 Tax=Aristolochia fimbriata TaxID=158543 RepID=A0AAV7E346_ARIFI|nr:hypothetical protein H6P81_018630 [Aristolochia fimbriata]